MADVSDDDNNVVAGEANGNCVEFGWDDDKPLTGRRKKALSAKKKKPGSFESMGLCVALLKGIKRKGYRLPTPIQRKTMPLILQGLDVVGMARTGSGKTAAFVIPMLQRLGDHSVAAGARALVLAPTRELALQTFKVIQELGRNTTLRCAVLVGGDSMEAQFAELAMNPDIMVATPGRLLHHLQEVEGLSLRTVEYVVLDEADRLFEMGFADQVRLVMKQLPDNRQTLLFSATLPKQLAEFSKAGLKDAQLVRLDADTKVSPDLRMHFFTCRAEDKIAALLYLLHHAITSGAPTLVFTSTRHHVELLHTLLKQQGIDSACVYGAMDQTARKVNVAKFRANKVSVMIVTDVAARGIDIPLLDNVINFDFPAKPKLFIHRAGRVARAGRPGAAYSLLTREEVPYLLDLHLFLSRPITPAPVISIQAAAAAVDKLDTTTSLLGSFPAACFATTGESVSRAISEHTDLQSLMRSADNAFSLYKKTRPGASAESVHRAKSLTKEGFHPWICSTLSSTAYAGLEAQQGMKEISEKLRSFRPAATVLEAEVASARRGTGAGLGAGPGLLSDKAKIIEVMRNKRAVHGVTISSSKARQAHLTAINDMDGTVDRLRDGGDGEEAELDALEQARAAASSAALLGDGVTLEGRFKDAEFYIPHLAGDRHEQEGFAVNGRGVDGAVLDLTADDAGGMSAQRKGFHWDKRKKRYVQLQANENVRAGKRFKTESGAKVFSKDKASGLYNNWVKKNKRRITGGDADDTAGASMAKDLAGRWKRGGRGWKNPLGGDAWKSNVRDEVKSADQVRKQRKEDLKNKTRQQGRSNGGGKPGHKAGGGKPGKKAGGGKKRK